MRRVNCKRRKNGKDFSQKIVGGPILAARIKVVHGLQMNAGSSEERHDFPVVARILLPHHHADATRDLVQHEGRRHAVRPGRGGTTFDLLLQARHANLEELIQVRGDDGEKLEPLQKRVGSVARFF
jgi:hypothetical protein